MRIHHVALRTRDSDRLESFYAGVLGLSVTRRDGKRSVWLAAGDTILMLERAEEDEPAASGDRRELLAFAIAPEMRANYINMLGRADTLIEDESAYTLYFRDPDGRRVGLSHYPEAWT